METRDIKPDQNEYEMSVELVQNADKMSIK